MAKYYKTMRGRLRIFGVAALVILLASAPFFFALNIWPGQPAANQATVVTVETGDSLGIVASAMEQSQLIDSGLLFRFYARASGLDRQLRAGAYDLPANVSPRQLLELLTRGNEQQHPIRIPEGVTMPVILAALERQNILSIRSRGLDHLGEELDLNLPFLEGAFFPETYFVTKSSSDLDVLRRAHDAMMVHLMREWQQRAPDLPLKTPAEALVLASIIEKESDGLSDRHQISQVFHLRLKKNMKLQTDPTVIYALGEDFDGDIKRRDLKVDSVFNTYRYRGLPPTPISSVSLASIRAAMHPASGDYLYFVARGDGSSQFSRTLEEHNAAVRRYQLSKGGQ